jgi:signal transduction histidine kinase
MFEPERRRSGGRRARGTGFGLAFVRKVVERYGGEVGVVSRGSTNRFYFTLPTLEPVQEPEARIR